MVVSRRTTRSEISISPLWTEAIREENSCVSLPRRSSTSATFGSGDAEFLARTLTSGDPDDIAAQSYARVILKSYHPHEYPNLEMHLLESMRQYCSFSEQKSIIQALASWRLGASESFTTQEKSQIERFVGKSLEASEDLPDQAYVDLMRMLASLGEINFIEVQKLHEHNAKLLADGLVTSVLIAHSTVEQNPRPRFLAPQVVTSSLDEMKGMHRTLGVGVLAMLSQGGELPFSPALIDTLPRKSRAEVWKLINGGLINDAAELFLQLSATELPNEFVFQGIDAKFKDNVPTNYRFGSWRRLHSVMENDLTEVQALWSPILLESSFSLLLCHFLESPGIGSVFYSMIESLNRQPSDPLRFFEIENQHGDIYVDTDFGLRDSRDPYSLIRTCKDPFGSKISDIIHCLNLARVWNEYVCFDDSPIVVIDGPVSHQFVEWINSPDGKESLPTLTFFRVIRNTSGSMAIFPLTNSDHQELPLSTTQLREGQGFLHSGLLVEEAQACLDRNELGLDLVKLVHVDRQQQSTLYQLGTTLFGRTTRQSWRDINELSIDSSFAEALNLLTALNREPEKFQLLYRENSHELHDMFVREYIRISEETKQLDNWEDAHFLPPFALAVDILKAFSKGKRSVYETDRSQLTWEGVEKKLATHAPQRRVNLDFRNTLTGRVQRVELTGSRDDDRGFINQVHKTSRMFTRDLLEKSGRTIFSVDDAVIEADIGTFLYESFLTGKLFSGPPELEASRRSDVEDLLQRAQSLVTHTFNSDAQYVTQKLLEDIVEIRVQALESLIGLDRAACKLRKMRDAVEITQSEYKNRLVTVVDRHKNNMAALEEEELSHYHTQTDIDVLIGSVELVRISDSTPVAMIYTVDLNGEVQVSLESQNNLKKGGSRLPHPAHTGGLPVRGAGVLHFDSGAFQGSSIYGWQRWVEISRESRQTFSLLGIDDGSGHYLPGFETLRQSLREVIRSLDSYQGRSQRPIFGYAENVLRLDAFGISMRSF